MNFKEWLLNETDHKMVSMVWHVTDKGSAMDILQNGFKPMTKKMGEGFVEQSGVWVSVNPRSAAALLRALQRMNRFRNDDEVINWWKSKGATDEEADRIYKYHLEDIKRRPERNHPGHLYLDFNQEVHPACGTGPVKVPHEEFLWNDLSRKLVGKDIVAVEAEYSKPLDAALTKTGGSFAPCEAGEFVKNMSDLQPTRIIKKPEDIF